MMKIAFIIDEFPTITNTFILNQIAGVIDGGHQVTIFANFNSDTDIVHPIAKKYNLFEKCIFFSPRSSNLLKRLMEYMKLIVHYLIRHPVFLLRTMIFFSKHKFKGPLYVLRNGRALIDSKHFDVIHCHFGPNGEMAAKLKKVGIISAPIITTFHGYDANVLPKIVGKSFYKCLSEYGDIFTCGSEFMINRVRRIGIDPKKIIKLPVGVDLKQFSLLHPMEIPKNKTCILTIARLVEVKGLHYSIEAFAKAQKKIPELEYSIVGEGPLRVELEELACALGVSDSVQFLGDRDQSQLKELYASSDVFILSSVICQDGAEEGQGLVLIEAQAMGIPVVSTNTGGIPETLRDNETGFLVPERNTDALAAKLVLLAGNRDLRIKMGCAGRKFVKNYFNIENLNSELIGIYKMKALGSALIDCCCRGNFSSMENYTGQHDSHSDINAFYLKEMDMPSPQYVFAQFLDLLPRYEFQHIVNKYQGDYRIKEFKCWNQLACMIFAHIRQEDSLRDIDIALNAHASKLYHIGIKQCPRSTLADANERRDYRIYEQFAKSLMQRARRAYANTQLAMDVDNAVYCFNNDFCEFYVKRYFLINLWQAQG
jgi:colanic acid/amylovoran biosynthesis glycosyltransferase